MSMAQRSLLDTIAAEGVHFALWSSIMSVGGGLGEIFVNHDARMHIAGEHAIPQLIEAHNRSKYLTNLMLIVSGVSGALAYQQTKDNYWLIGSGLMLAGIPYCALVEYPVAEQLKFLTLDAKSEKAKTLLASWGGIQLEKHKNKPKSYKQHKLNIYESKKEHQVEILAPIINQLANMAHANSIIDYKSGRDYLGVKISHDYDRNVLGIESCEATVHSNLSKYQKELYDHIKYKSTSTIVNSETNFGELFYQTLHCCSSSFLLCNIHACRSLSSSLLYQFTENFPVRATAKIAYYCNENDPCSFTLSHRLIRKKQTKLDRNARMLAVHPFETNKADQALNSGVWYRALMQVLLVEVDGLTTGLQDIKLGKLTKRWVHHNVILINRDYIIDYIQKCYDKNFGGYSPCPDHDLYLLYTLSVVQLLVQLNRIDLIDKKNFIGDQWKEIDTCFSFCAVACLKLIDSLDIIDIDRTTNFIMISLNFDGDFGCIPGAKSHAGQSYCCLGFVLLVQRLDNLDLSTGNMLA
ncbi:unnamed protein product [Rotaria sordida]|uniref:Geranylgeranyl transferase type II subunit beta n=2 Tax=Rotaria sordida TaxID=392033 RepID=A0A815AW56_9BILA|nr:unnamed protein product [Rotaria sordida]CAF3929362.1 unnamed protein product [Rotaria sordida]